MTETKTPYEQRMRELLDAHTPPLLDTSLVVELPDVLPPDPALYRAIQASLEAALPANVKHLLSAQLETDSDTLEEQQRATLGTWISAPETDTDAPIGPPAGDKG